ANENSRPLRCLIFRGSIPHPTQLLCTLRDHCRQGSRNTRYQAGAAPYLGRSSTGWIAPACLAHSFDHLVGAGEPRRGHFEAEGFGGAEGGHKLEFSRLYHRQVRRLYALEYPPGVDALLANCIGNIGPVTDQTTSLGIVPYRIYRGNQVARREDRNLNAPAVEERVRGHE